MYTPDSGRRKDKRRLERQLKILCSYCSAGVGELCFKTTMGLRLAQELNKRSVISHRERRQAAAIAKASELEYGIESRTS
jgi:hypothetical protein